MRECERVRKDAIAAVETISTFFNHCNYRKFLVFLTAIAEGDGCLLQKLSDKPQIH